MYAKVFRQIYDSSIAENPEIRFTFMDLIVLADSDGVVDMTHESIARITNRPLEVIKSTITALEGPDPRSRTPDENGARITRLDDHRNWGWWIVNYDRFRDTATDLQRREQTKKRVKRFRDLRKSLEPQSCNAPVTQCNASVTPPYASPSSSETGKGVQGEGFAEIPSWDEFWAYSQFHAPMAEWFARDKWAAAEQENWRRMPNWKAYASRCSAWWRQAGSQAFPPSKTNGSVPAWKQIDILTEQIRDHPANRESLSHRKCSDAETKDYFDKRKKLKMLKEQATA